MVSRLLREPQQSVLIEIIHPLREMSSYFIVAFCFSSCLFACLKLNPSKLEKNEDVNLNLAHLLNILSELVEKIFMAAEILPP